MAAKFVIGGANGLIGRALVKSLSEDGHDVVALVRENAQIPGVRTAKWDGRSDGEWIQEFEGAAAVINLSGSPIAVKWTRDNQETIIASRVNSTRAFRFAIEVAKNPPKVWLNGSAVGFYGDTGESWVDENSPAGTGFLAETCIKWEAEAHSKRVPVIKLRTGIVLAHDGGVMPSLGMLAKGFLGGPQGSGNQFMPWTHIEDEIGLMRWTIETQADGPVNACTPEPVRNREFMAMLRKVLHRPWSPPVPKFGLELASAFGAPDPEVVLVSSRVRPKVAETGGYQWRFADLGAAIKSTV